MRLGLLAVDWDDTVWDRKNKCPMPGAKHGLGLLREQGWNIIVYSANNSDWIERMIVEHELHLLEVWRGEGKPIAHCYLDDRAVRFTSWDTAPDEIATLYRRDTDDENVLD